MAQRREGEPARAAVAAALAAAALVLLAAAFFNGAPLLYPDSLDYLLHGSEAMRALVSGAPGDWWSTRSFLYALAILPLHAHASAWPVVGFQAIVTAWVLWLTLRTTLPRSSPARLLAVAVALSVLTSASWFVSYVMPDLFAALLILGTYLLCFQWGRLGGAERAGVVVLVWFAIVSHSSHLILATGLVPIAAVVGRRFGSTRSDAWRPALRLACVVGVAAGATLVINAALLGEASLSGRRPPFLLARVIADGTAAPFLQDHCAERDLAVCRRVGDLPDNVRDVLWSEGSVWGSASREQRRRMREEELAVVLGSIRSHPLAQLSASLANFGRQLWSFGLWGSFYPDPYIEARIEEALPRFASSFRTTRQGREALHEGAFGALHRATVIASLVALAGYAVARRRRIPPALAALAALVLFGVVGNAAITGVLSNVEQRYQSRVVWLVPLLAGVAWLHVWDARNAGSRPADAVQS